MPHQGILLEVPGDWEAVVADLDESGHQYKKVRGINVWVENTYISLVGCELRLETDYAIRGERKPFSGNFGYGEKCLPYKEQKKIFYRLKRTVLKHRASFYEKSEQKMEAEKEKKEKEWANIKRAFNLEGNILGYEHQLEDQIKKTRRFLAGMQTYLPKKGEGGNTIDGGAIAKQREHLNMILLTLKKEKITAVSIKNKLNPSIEIKLLDGEIKNQKKHLKFLAVELKRFGQRARYAAKDVRYLQVTSKMRKYFKHFYEQIADLFFGYSQLFRKEIK